MLLCSTILPRMGNHAAIMGGRMKNLGVVLIILGVLALAY
jgi:hypothetical protein